MLRLWQWLRSDNARRGEPASTTEPRREQHGLEPRTNRGERDRLGRRFLLWLDGVGGFLVCLSDRVSIGQPVGRRVDVPIMADLARVHAWIVRGYDNYKLHAARSATVNDRPVVQSHSLSDAAHVRLGRDVQLRFFRPSLRSRTARLELVSPHRLSLATNDVLLLSESCVIGPDPVSHVVVAGWKRGIELERFGSELWIRAAAPFQIDGRRCLGRGRLTLASRVEGDGFSLALEPLTD